MPEYGARDPLEELHPTARAILVAARTVLRERGMAGLTLEAVANEANTSRTQVPYHFGSRAGLIEALFDWLFFDSWTRFMSPGDSPWPMTVHQSLQWSREEMTDLTAIRDSLDLVVHSLRDESVRNRLAMLYRRDRRLEIAALGSRRAPAPRAPTGRTRMTQPTGGWRRSVPCSWRSTKASPYSAPSTLPSTSTALSRPRRLSSRTASGGRTRRAKGKGAGRARHRSMPSRRRSQAPAAAHSRAKGPVIYAASTSLASKGRWQVRAYHPADATDAATYSTWKTFPVK